VKTMTGARIESWLGGNRGASSDPRAERRCAACAHFRNDDGYLEAVFAGLTSLSSARGSARADDGVCLRHDRYLSARASCADFAPAPSSGAMG
jgi:hypothetical protein